MSDEPTLQTATKNVDHLCEVVALHLSYPAYSGDRLIRPAFSRRRADLASRRIVPLVVESLRGDWDYRIAPEACEIMARNKVRQSLGFIQLLIWRALIPIIIRLVVRWWFSDNGAAMRSINK